MLKIILNVIVGVVLLTFLIYQLYGLVKDLKNRKAKKKDNNNDSTPLDKN